MNRSSQQHWPRWWQGQWSGPSHQTCSIKIQHGRSIYSVTTGCHCCVCITCAQNPWPEFNINLWSPVKTEYSPAGDISQFSNELLAECQYQHTKAGNLQNLKKIQNQIKSSRSWQFLYKPIKAKEFLAWRAQLLKVFSGDRSSRAVP